MTLYDGCNTTLAKPQTHLNDVTTAGRQLGNATGRGSHHSTVELRTKDLEKIQLLHQRSRSAAIAKLQLNATIIYPSS